MNHRKLHIGIAILAVPLLLPHIMIYYFSKDRDKILMDVDMWCSCLNFYKSNHKSSLLDFIHLLLQFPEYRNLFYCRCGKISKALFYLPPKVTLEIRTPSKKIGGGLFIQHGFSTIIYANSIGKNCWINQQVTIGSSGKYINGIAIPTIGNNVHISCGSIILGAILIGDNSNIGANCVVHSDLKKNSIVRCSHSILVYVGNEKQLLQI